MQIKRFVASSLAALMAGATFAGAALAASTVGGILGTLGQQAASGTPYLVVIGDNAAASDVVGAIDVASALAQQVTKPITQTGAISIQGKELTTLTFGSNLQQAFGNPLTQTEIPFLFRDKLNYNSTDYYVEEEIVVPSAQVKNDPSTLNGTTFIDFSSNVPKYKYVFLNDLPTPAFGTPDAYANPVLVKIMGQPYYIVNTGTNSITVMSGTVGMADASTPVAYGNYKVYVVDGADKSWAKIQIKDASGNIVRTDIINQGATNTYSDLGLKVKLLNVWASTVTNTVTGKLVVGSELEKTISSGEEFAPYWKWDISIANSGKFTQNDYIGVVYAPNDTATWYLPVGSTLKAPNDYFEIGYPKNVINQFAEIKIEPGTITAYASATAPSADISSQPAIVLSANYPVFNNRASSKVAIVVNGTTDTTFVAYYDESVGKYVHTATSYNVTAGKQTVLIQGSYDKTNFNITFDLANNLKIKVMTDSDIKANYTYAGGKFSLGSPSSAEASDISVGWASGVVDGTWDHDAVSPYGVILKAVKTNAASDRVVIDIPADQQTADVYIGRATGAAVTSQYQAVVPLSLPVAKLAKEVTDADKANANIVLVGGPCANSLVQALVDAKKLDASFTCAGGTPGAAWTPGAAYVKVIDNAFATGKVALLVAGTNAEDTRLATTLLSQGKLADRTEAGVKITGTVTAPAITPA